MDFFASQDQARRKTSLLVGYFSLAVVLISLAVYFLIVGIIGFVQFQATPDGAPPPPLRLWYPEVFLWSVGGTVLLILLGSLVEILRLRSGGGAMVARQMGGRLVSSATEDPVERRLLNVVEEMSIAAGIPMPPVYILENERSINAFAAGYHPSDAILGVTHGAVRLLNRDELQGVIGHEFSHILNGDMRLNIRLMGVLYGILLLAIIGQTLLEALRYTRVRGGDRRGGGGVAIVVVFAVGAGLVLVGNIGVFFGRLIQASISRQREFLADAASVQFTRNPSGLAGALKKIGGLAFGSRIRTPHAESVSHMFFGESRKPGLLAGLMATHPPLTDRIRRLDPAFDGTFPEIRATPKESVEILVDKTLAEIAAGQAPAGGSAPPPLTPEFLMRQIGVPLQHHMLAAQALLVSLPADLRAQARDPAGARAVIYALLLDADPAVRERQARILDQEADPAVAQKARAWREPLAGLDASARIPLVDLCIPALKTLSEAEYFRFKETVRKLAAADEEIDLFEYTLLRSLVRNLDAQFVKPKTRHAQYYSVNGLIRECSVLLTLLARTGQADEAEARAAFREAADMLHVTRAKGGLRFLPPGEATLAELDTCLDRLALATPLIKRHLVAACLQCLVHDGRVTANEAELFRAVAYALDVPVPFLGEGNIGASRSPDA